MNIAANMMWHKTGKEETEPLLIGLEMSRADVRLAIQRTTVSLATQLAQALLDLETVVVARNKGWRIPTQALWVALAYHFPELVRMDSRLGLGKAPARVPAFVFSDQKNPDPALAEDLVAAFSQWVTDALERGRSEAEVPLVERVRRLVTTENLVIKTERVEFSGVTALDFEVLAHEIGRKLAGVELFEGLGPCFPIARAASAYASNKVVLTTRPALTEKGRSYSMRASISIVTMPCNPGRFFLDIKPSKRVWAKDAPEARYGRNSTFSAYVLPPGKPGIQVQAQKHTGQWDLPDEYVYLQRMSDGRIPATLAEIGEQNPASDWWLGVPELTTLYPKVSAHSTLERDEENLMESVRRNLGDLLGKPLAQIGFRQVKIMAGAKTVEKAMISPGAKPDIVRTFRQQSLKVLEKLHPGKKALLLMIGGSAAEQLIVADLARQLFDDSVILQQEVLPYQAHGFKQTLPLPDGKPRDRFAARVKAWGGLADMIRAQQGPVAMIVCAPDFIDNKPEDTLNKPAARHALAKAGANVQYLLPMAGNTAKKDSDPAQDFAYRAENAMLDVLFAHAGAVVDPVLVKVAERLPPDPIKPKGIYGISVMRSHAQYRSGQKGVQFIFYTRLDMTSGKTDARFVHQNGLGVTKITDWAPLSQALCQMGALQPHGKGLSSDWLRREFPQYTKAVLADIEAVDPHAVIMLEWDTLGGLWVSISDQNLNEGHPPKIGEVPLSLMAGMTFIRIRRREDTLKLRTRVTRAYTPINQDGTLTAQVDTYPSTQASLVEVTEHRPGEGRQRSAHYVATSSYLKTSKPRRGLSCFQTTHRMMGTGTGANAIYQLEASTPANKDYGLPSSLDITVLQAPQGASLDDYAVITLALRKGHAHHDDWTALPIPLFYRAKAEDYVIRYASDEDEPDA